MSLKRRRRFLANELEQIRKHEESEQGKGKPDHKVPVGRIGGALVSKAMDDLNIVFEIRLPSQHEAASFWEKRVLVPVNLEQLIEPLIVAFCSLSLTNRSATRSNWIYSLEALIRFWKSHPPTAVRPEELDASDGERFAEWFRTELTSSGHPRSFASLRTVFGNLNSMMQAANANSTSGYGMRINSRRVSSQSQRNQTPAPAMDEVMFFRLRQTARDVIRDYRENLSHAALATCDMDPEQFTFPNPHTSDAVQMKGALFDAVSCIKAKIPDFPFSQPTAHQLNEILGDSYLNMVHCFPNGIFERPPLSRQSESPPIEAVAAITPGSKVFNWTVLGAAKHPRFRGNYWKCRCKCGVERLISNSVLSNGKRRGCRKCAAKHRSQVRSSGLRDALISVCAPTRIVMGAYAILIYMELGRLNPRTFENLKLSDLRWSQNHSQGGPRNNPNGVVQFETIAVVGPKHRSTRPQVTVLNSLRESDSHSYGGYTLLKEWVEITKPLRSYGPEKYRDLLWLYVGHSNMFLSQSAVTPALFGDINSDSGLRKNMQYAIKDLVERAFPRADSIPPGTNMRGIRNLMAHLVYRITSGDVRAVQAFLGHRFRSTTERYLNQTLIRQHTRVRLGHTLSKVSGSIREAPNYHHRDDPKFIHPKDYTVESLRNAATPGYSCIDNLASPIRTQRRGVLCTAVGACYACPNKVLNVDSPQAFAHLRAAKEQLSELAGSSFYAASLLSHVDDDLKRFSRPAIESANRHELTGRRIPKTYFE